MRKFINLSVLILLFCAPAATAQELSKKEEKMQLQPGTVKGIITIKQKSGNNLGRFNCDSMWIEATRLGKAGNWKRSHKAEGEISDGKCSYSISNIPAGEQFTISISPRFANRCDQKSFIAERTFPTELKGGETRVYNLTVLKIHCSVVK